jgi:hypothetical protein
MYFKEFPSFLYDFKYGDTTKTSVVKDITRNVHFRREVLSNVTLFDEYDIQDGETPEIIAEKIYGNPQYHWIVMLANDRHDYINDFPMDYNTLTKTTVTKYNPQLYAQAGDWYVENGKIYFKITNFNDAFNPTQLTSPVSFTIKASTTETDINETHIWNDGSNSINYSTQYFSQDLDTTVTGYPTGDLYVTTTGRENNPVYWVNEAGFRVNNDAVGALAVNGLQEEERLNEQKRRIKIISPTVVSTILTQFRDLI